MQTCQLIIVGASVRAAAFSALRAGLQPWCADLFADADLQARCPCSKLPPRDYPEGLWQVFDRAPPVPWMYTGALENRKRLVARLSAKGVLWGNDSRVLARARSPLVVATILTKAGLRCPEIRLRAKDVPQGGRWLAKPRFSAGGTGIHFWSGRILGNASQRPIYFQEHIEGKAHSAVYVGDGISARLLGVTEQLIGEAWLHAAPFHYDGSIGPVQASSSWQEALNRLGQVLAQGIGLRGLFGVDFILRDGEPWPVEVNPRYTSSVEVLEYALGIPFLSFHRQVFDPQAPQAAIPVKTDPPMIGKAILFAREPMIFPADGPWLETLHQPPPIDKMPPFADIPHAGQIIPAKKPILSFFAGGNSADDCLEKLRQMAACLDRILQPE